MSKPKPLSIEGRVRRFRGTKPRGSAPLGVAFAPLDGPLVEGDAIFVAPDVEDVDVPWELAARLPEPSLGVLVVVGPSVARAGFFARLVGSEVRVPRAVRGSSLLLRGYRDIGGGVDPKSGLDLCWGGG